MVRSLAEHLPDGRVRGVAAGLHVLLELQAGTDAAAVARRAAAAGVRVANLDTYRFRDLPEAPGLVLGYGNLADHRVDDAVARLAAAVRSYPALTALTNAANSVRARRPPAGSRTG